MKLKLIRPIDARQWDGVIHANHSPALALLMNPAHGHGGPRAWEAEVADERRRRRRRRRGGFRTGR